MPPELDELDKKLSSHNSQVKAYKTQIAQLKDKYNGLGDNAEKILRIENHLVDLKRQKDELHDVLVSHTKYISSSYDYLTNSTNAVVKQEKLSKVQAEINETRMLYRKMDKKMKEDHTAWEEKFEEMVEVTR